ncbi:hypothetical protein GALL_341100 [mine drainage metagenome]|uniref:Uncharacterized protein n=1 Tax=mine drainage metagenome TaxID=410659 RepID=A0A1J5QW21_9ZZZZ
MRVGHRGCDAAELAQPRGGGRGDLAGQRHQQLVGRGVQHGDLRATLGRAPQLRGQQRVILAQRRADDQRALQLRNVGQRQPQAGHRVDGGEIAAAHAEVDVVAAQRSHQLAQQEQLLDRAGRSGQRADARRAVDVEHTLQRPRDEVQRGRPVDFAPAFILADHRRGQAIGGVQAFVAETVAVGDPALVDRFVGLRHHAQHAVVLDLHDHIGAEAVVRADRGAALQFPTARGVAERLAGQRADRAQVDHVARQFRVHRAFEEAGDLRMLAAVGHAQLHDSGHFLAETHATGAMDAAGHFLHRDQRAGVLVEHDALFFLVARGRRTVAHGQILQLAFAALVADRAVERMVDQQQLHHTLLRLARTLGLRAHDHALRHRRGARRQRLGRLLDVDQAHAAVGGDRELGVIAEMRYVDVELVRGVHHHRAFGHLDLAAVDFQFNHDVVSVSVAAA